MSLAQRRILAEVAAEALAPLDQWAHKCHEASIALVRSGVLGPARVARGASEGIAAQHSWVVLGDDCYDEEALIVDPTRWSYIDRVERALVPHEPACWVGTYADGLHTPHGKGSIWKWGRPDSPSGEPVELTPREPWSRSARDFLEILGPLDFTGWVQLAHAPVEGWPAGEIIDAMCESGLRAYVPVDIVGMVTDRNPGGLYLASGLEEAAA